jgi:hypothetical protein
MRHGRKVLLVLMVLLIGACNAKTPENVSGKAANPPVKPTDKEVPVMNNESQKAAEVQPPSPSSVLYFIYQKDGDGALSYEVENGSWATYWYGYSFDLGGKHYFTGFATQTPDKYGKSEEENYAAPDAKVTITQATFFTTSPEAEKPWTFDGNQYSVGEFGGYEKGNTIDETRKPQTYQTPDGKLLLAVPTWYLATGVQVNAFDLLLFNPHELLKVDDKRWDYLGNIVIGTDNGAACDETPGATQACAKSTGTLSFEPQEGSSLPLLKVRRSGTETVSAGKVRTLGPVDIYEYRYDSEKKQYQ